MSDEPQDDYDRLRSQNQALQEENKRLTDRVDQLECPDPMCHPDEPVSHLIAERTKALQERIEKLEKGLGRIIDLHDNAMMGGGTLNPADVFDVAYQLLSPTQETDPE